MWFLNKLLLTWTTARIEMIEMLDFLHKYVVFYEHFTITNKQHIYRTYLMAYVANDGWTSTTDNNFPKSIGCFDSMRLNKIIICWIITPDHTTHD